MENSNSSAELSDGAVEGVREQASSHDKNP